jgi:hypothetical protein
MSLGREKNRNNLSNLWTNKNGEKERKTRSVEKNKHKTINNSIKIPIFSNNEQIKITHKTLFFNIQTKKNTICQLCTKPTFQYSLFCITAVVVVVFANKYLRCCTPHLLSYLLSKGETVCGTLRQSSDPSCTQLHVKCILHLASSKGVPKGSTNSQILPTLTF